MKKISTALILALSFALLMCAFAIGSSADDGNQSGWQYVASDGTLTVTDSMATAISGAKAGTTVTMLSDEHVTATGAYVNINKNLTVDLGDHTLTFEQTNQAYVAVTGAVNVTFANGTIRSFKNATQAHPVFRVQGTGAVLNINDVKSYTGGLVYSYNGQDMTVNINGGEHYMSLSSETGVGAFIEARATETVNVNSSKIYVGSNRLIASFSYKTTTGNYGDTYTFTNSEIIASSASYNMLQYANRYTTLVFNGCKIVGSFSPSLHSWDSAVSVEAIDEGSIIIGDGTYVASGSTFSSGLLTPADGCVMLSVSETYDIALNLSSGTLYDDTFAISTVTQSHSFTAKSATVPDGTVDVWTCDHANRGAFVEGSGRYCINCVTYLFYYADYGAAGDGATNDFGAIRAAHVAANAKVNGGYNSAVVAGSGASGNGEFYIGVPTTTGAITVQTNTDWSGATIIIDDTVIEQGSSYQTQSIFAVYGYNRNVDYTSYFSNGIEAGATNVGFAPGRPMMINLVDSSIKQYIRYGANANSGQNQSEVILVDANGNIDSSTPVEWTYTSAMTAKGYGADDAPIKISGLNDEGVIDCVVKTLTNPNVNVDSYNAYSRNIRVTRSNVTIEGIEHQFVEDASEDAVRQAYAGFVNVYMCNDVTMKDMLVQQHIHRYTTAGVLLGSYEFSASTAANVSWINCDVTNFFNDDGSVEFKGLFGTNNVRNMYLSDCFLTSFDAHTAASNVTIENSTFEHLNFIGNGDIVLRNVTVYADGYGCAINLRDDYGSTWHGNLYIDGLDLRYSDYTGALSLIRATFYSNHYFGYTTYLPTNVTVNDFNVSHYTYSVDENGVRSETTIAQNDKSVYFCARLNTLGDVSEITETNLNPYQPTENVYVTDCGVNWIWPTGDFFADMKIYIDGVERN